MTYELAKQLKDTGFPQTYKNPSHYIEKDSEWKYPLNMAGEAHNCKHEAKEGEVVCFKCLSAVKENANNKTKKSS